MGVNFYVRGHAIDVRLLLISIGRERDGMNGEFALQINREHKTCDNQPNKKLTSEPLWLID